MNNDYINIVVLHGQVHKGSTYNITKLLLDNIYNKNIIEFFLGEVSLDYCIGCFNCFIKGEDACPHSDIIQNIAKAIETADLIIIDSPCYVFGMSGQLKTFFDHMAYRWMSHRPHRSMFNKTAVVISTAAGAGSRKVTKSLKENLFYWGIPKIYRCGFNVGAMNWESVSVQKKSRIEKDILKIAIKILNNIGRIKPGIKTKLVFKIMKMNQKSNNWNKLDKSHWEENGWLGIGQPW